MFNLTLFLLQLSAASITIFLSWFHLLLLLQRFDQVGIYVVMFLEILQTLIKVLMVFSILIIAFGLAFYVLLSKVGDDGLMVFIKSNRSTYNVSVLSTELQISIAVIFLYALELLFIYD